MKLLADLIAFFSDKEIMEAVGELSVMKFLAAATELQATLEKQENDRVAEAIYSLQNTMELLGHLESVPEEVTDHLQEALYALSR
jgi:hypothetical protein